jgi:predicted ATPase
MYFRLFAPLTGTLLAEREGEAGRVEIGLTTLDAQLAASEQTGQHWFDAEVHRVRGELLLKLQRPDVAAAESALMRAIEIARSQQTRTFELRAALSLAKLYKMTGRHQVASELLVPALAGFNAGPEVPEVEEAQRLLTMREQAARAIS